jgi:hypothetical protein
MPRIRILPVLGLKTNVPADDPTLFKGVAEGVAMAYDTDGQNVDYQRNPGAVTKSFGTTVWSSSAVGSPTKTNFLFQLEGSSATDNLIGESGRVFYYNGSKAPVQLQNAYLDYSGLASGPAAAGETVTGDSTSTVATLVTGVSSSSGTLYISGITGGTGNFSAAESLTFSGGASADCDSVVQRTTFSNNTGDLYSVIQFGDYMLMADSEAGHSPQKWMNGDANLTNLITSTAATLYKFRYLVEWQRRIIAAYSNQINGDLEIRWSDALPTMTDLDFPAANQLYKPGHDSITGISKLGANAVLLYGTDTINQISYYPDSTTIFGIIPLVQGQGSASHQSIVNYQGANWFFNKNYGFVRYVGGSKILLEDIISRDIEDTIQAIDSRYYDRIVGKALPLTNQIVWSTPLAAGATPTHLLYYHLPTKTWSKEVKAAEYIDTWTQTAGQYRKLVMADTDGHVYSSTGEALAGAAVLDGYRIEPIMDFGDSTKQKIISEIWFGIIVGGDYSLDVSHRAGDTVKELLAASFASVGSLSLNNPDPPVLYTSLFGRYHQFKWGTNLDSEAFAVNWIDFRFTVGGQY